jgi:hypothetical protein
MGLIPDSKRQMVYKSTVRYQILSVVGILNASIIIAISLISLNAEIYTVFIALFLPGVILIYLLLLVFPDEVIFDEESVMFRTRLRRVFFDFQDIKEIKPHITTRTFVMSGGDKDKAVVFYQIRLKSKPWRLLMFGSGIKKFRELNAQLADIASKHDTKM